MSVDNCGMRHKGLSFREILDSATRLVPRLRKSDGSINLSAVSSHCKEHGHPVSQSTLYRHYWGEQDARELSQETIDALCLVFRLPRSLLEGDAIGADMEKALTKVSLETLLLAEKIQRLPMKARDNLLNQVEEILDREEQLKRAFEDSNVVPIDRERR